jgi:hypothetical protein
MRVPDARVPKSPQAIDRLVNEWARSEKRVISGPVGFEDCGRHGNHGQWAPLPSYRRLLAGLRLRAQGVTDAREIRLLQWAAGYGGDERKAPADLAHVFRRVAARVRRELPIADAVWSRAATPLSLRRRVLRELDSFNPAAIAGLTPGQCERLGAFLT